MGNTLIKVDCVDQRLFISTAPVLASGGINEDVVEFQFCPLWDGFVKTAVFYRDESSVYYSPVGTDDRCTIPAEVLQSDGDMFFGVFGTSGSVTRTSEILRYKIRLGAITENLKPSEPAPDIYIQILEALSEMDNKVDKIEGKGLSTNDYTNEDKAKLAEVDNKVDKVDGKVLSTNDYTDADKEKLAGIAEGATNVAVDSTLKNSGQAADAKTTGDRLGAVEAFTVDPQEYELTGNPVQLENYEGMPMHVVSTLLPIQSGSGDPGPDNIRPISGRTGVKLTRCGKNLLKYTSVKAESTTINGVTFTVNADGTITVNGTASDNASFILTSSDTNPTLRGALLGNQITMSGCPSGGATGKYAIRLFQHAETNSRMDDTGSGVTTTFSNSELPFNVAIIVWSGVTVSNLIFRPMIRFASDADSTYEPYTGDTYAADFGQTVYGGTLDWASGVLTVDRAMVTLSSSINMDYIRNTGNVHQFNLYPGLTFSIKSANAICSHYKIDSKAMTDVEYTCFYDNGPNQLIIRDTHSTVADFKSYLDEQVAAGTPVQVCYKLATPTTIQLTPQMVAALSGFNTLYDDSDGLTVSGRKDILWLTNSLIERIKTLESAVISLGGNV